MTSNKHGHNADNVHSKNVKSFLSMIPSDFFPLSVTESGTIIINADPHTEKDSQWLSIHFQIRPYSANYFDFYGIVPFIPNNLTFLRRNSTVWEYNTTQMKGLTSAF